MTAVQPTAVVRHVDISALSPRDELLAVLRVGLIVVVTVAVYLSARFARGSGAADGAGARSARNLLPFQTLIQAHDPTEQLMFRLLQVALLEAQNIRSTDGVWPEVATLAEQGIEPFVADPTNRGAAYAWRFLRAGVSVNYLGIPNRSDAAAWLLVIQEPDPLAPPEPFQDDEEHARLLDGTVLHVSLWRHALGSRVSPQMVRLPQAEGWTQVFAVGPSTSH